MKTQDTFPTCHSASSAPMCVRCDAPMKIKTIAPTMFAHSVDDIVYVCRSCGIESKRAVHGAEAPQYAAPKTKPRARGAESSSTDQ